MTSSQDPSDEDWQDIALAHRYRLSLPSSPPQSNFRVLALLFFSFDAELEEPSPLLPLPFNPNSHRTQDGRHFVVGTNDEPGYIGGALCAERAGMVQLRFLRSYKIAKIVIATDAEQPIAPGMLCREFLGGHSQVPWDTRIVMAGSPAGGDKSDAGADPSDIHTDNIAVSFSTLGKMYTYPSPYARLNASDSVEFGEKFASSDMGPSNLSAKASSLLQRAINEAKSCFGTIDAEIHPIHFGAAAMLDDDETIIAACQVAGLEYGCTLDSVSRLPLPKGFKFKLLVQADQFGIAHAPFASARAYLTEHPVCDDGCRILVHASKDGTLKLNQVPVSELAQQAPTWMRS